MEKKIEYKLDAPQGIFFKYYYGDIYFKDLELSWEDIIKKKLIPSTIKKFILDYRQANIRFDASKAATIARFYVTHDQIFSHSKIALIMEKPEQVVFPMLVEAEGENFAVKPFYTIEAALEWLI